MCFEGLNLALFPSNKAREHGEVVAYLRHLGFPALKVLAKLKILSTARLMMCLERQATVNGVTTFGYRYGGSVVPGPEVGSTGSIPCC